MFIDPVGAIAGDDAYCNDASYTLRIVLVGYFEND